MIETRVDAGTVKRREHEKEQHETEERRMGSEGRNDGQKEEKETERQGPKDRNRKS